GRVDRNQAAAGQAIQMELQAGRRPYRDPEYGRGVREASHGQSKSLGSGGGVSDRKIICLVRQPRPISGGRRVETGVGQVWIGDAVVLVTGPVRRARRKSNRALLE